MTEGNKSFDEAMSESKNELESLRAGAERFDG